MLIMKKLQIILGIAFAISLLIIIKACSNMNQIGTFGYDVEFLKNHKKTILLMSNDGKCQIAIVGDYQGRVMTSTANGMKGKSYGWINYELISSAKFNDHINVFGGEDRFWLGPEAGQYSIFFKPGSEFILDNWFTPKEIDSEPFVLIENNDTCAVFYKKIQLTNYNNFTFDIEVDRKISILNKADIEKNLDINLGNNISFVAFQSDNVIKNIGDSAWTKNQGLLSIWILGMFNPSDNTTVFMPYKGELEVNSNYFGKIGPDRLQSNDKVVLFKGDGKYRSKIGLPPQNALPFLGSYDMENEVLTIIEYTFESDSCYVNSLWELQEEPYGGDVINSYNDGPMDNGDLLGPFYELETSSSAKELKKNESLKHIHRTYHFEGSQEKLNEIAKKIFGVELKEVSLKQN